MKKPTKRPRPVRALQAVLVDAHDGPSVLHGVNMLLKSFGIVVRKGGTAKALGSMRYLTLRRRS